MPHGDARVLPFPFKGELVAIDLRGSSLGYGDLADDLAFLALVQLKHRATHGNTGGRGARGRGHHDYFQVCSREVEAPHGVLAVVGAPLHWHRLVIEDLARRILHCHVRGDPEGSLVETVSLVGQRCVHPDFLFLNHSSTIFQAQD